jgi:hypothetical protein
MAAPSPALAAFPGSNGKIAIGTYPFAPTGTKRIDTRTLDEGDTGALGLEVGKLQYGTYSADGTRLLGYYGEFGGSGLPSGMYVADPVTSSLTRVLDSYRPAKFLPDGRILYLSGTSLRRINQDGTGDVAMPVPALPPSATGFVVAPDGGSIYYWTADWDTPSDQIRRLDLTTGVSTTLSSRAGKLGDYPTAVVLDVSPDGSQLLLRIDTNGEISGGGALAPAALYVMSTSGGAQRLLPTTAGTRPSGLFSPDGTMVVYLGTNKADDAGEPSGDLPVHVINVDGTGDRRLVMYPQASQNGFTTLAWQPGPPLAVSVDGDQLIGDYIELDLSLSSTATTPFTNLRYDDSGHAPGLVFNTALYSPEYRAGFTVVAGPAPTLLDVIGPLSRTQHQYLVSIDSPGNVQVRANVHATGAKTGEITQGSTQYVVARNRDLTPAEEALTIAGGWTELHAEIQRDIEASVDDTTGIINTAVLKSLPSRDRAAARSTSPVEEALAQSAGVPPDALSWLPTDTPTAIKAYLAFQTSKFAARERVVRQKLGSAYTFGLKVPADYWYDQVMGDPSTTIPVGTTLAEIGGELKTGTKSYAARAHALATDPIEQHKFRQAVELSAIDMEKKLRRVADVAPGKARQIADQIARDPVKGAQMLGNVYGTIEGEVGFMVAEVAITPNKAGIASGLKRIGVNASKLLKTDVADVGRTLRAMRMSSKADTLPTAASLGMPSADQTRWAAIVVKLEEKAAKYGFKVDIQMSFRPRNPFSAEIPDGAGKNMFMKGKSGTELDLILGMDRSGLGKLVIYKPVRPANYAKLPPSMRAKIDERMKAMNEARAEWANPKSDLGRARRPKGVKLTSEVKGQTVTTVDMRIKGYEKNGTISVKYLELTVDGRKIVKPGKPKWVVSDYDGNAILTVKGKNLPAGVRGMLELEAMALQREAGTRMATSFHGFTHNGFDMPTKIFRKNIKFLLEGMSPKEAKAALSGYLEKYPELTPEQVQELLATKSGDYVIRVTRDGASAGQGL